MCVLNDVYISGRPRPTATRQSTTQYQSPFQITSLPQSVKTLDHTTELRSRSGHKWINLWPTSCFRRPSLRPIPSVILCRVAVSQGLVLGLVLFLIYKWTTRQLLYADDCVLYKNVCSLQDCLMLQEDLTDRTSLA